jgi:hypothetical protein
MALEYKIGADVKGFQQGVNQTIQGFSKLEQASGKAFANVQKNAAGGAAALGSLSQVARDLPFGFIAIQNNLPIVFDQFGALSRQAGGLGGALKALGAALIGPAGIAFAVGAVISGVTSLIQKYGSLGAAVDALTASYSNQSAEQKVINELSKDANKNAADDIARLQVLASVAGDVTNATENRVEAANELIKVYGEYLPNLTREALLNNQAADAINKAKDAILAKALAAAAENKLAEIGAKILDNQLAQVEAVRRYGTAQEDLRKQLAASNKEGIKGREGINTQTVFFNTQLEKAEGNLKDLGTQAVSLQKEYDTLLKLATGFANQAGDAFIRDTKPAKAPATGKPAKAPATGKPARVVVPFVEIVPEKVTLDPNALADAAITRDFTKQNNIAVDIPVKLTFPETVRKEFNDFADLQLARLQNQLDLTKQFSDQLAAQLSQSFSNVFASLGEGIGQVLSGVSNGFSVAQLVLTSLADILINVGKLAIQTGVAILGIKKALQSLNPAVAIAGGVALVALGTAVKGRLANSVPKFAEGGIVTRPTAGIFGEAGPEAIMPLDKLNNMIGNMGGGGNVEVFGRFELAGDNLYASVQRTAQRQGRVFR